MDHEVRVEKWEGGIEEHGVTKPYQSGLKNLRLNDSPQKDNPKIFSSMMSNKSNSNNNKSNFL